MSGDMFDIPANLTNNDAMNSLWVLRRNEPQSEEDEEVEGEEPQQ